MSYTNSDEYYDFAKRIQERVDEYFQGQGYGPGEIRWDDQVCLEIVVQFLFEEIRNARCTCGPDE